MTPERWQQIGELFKAAIRIDRAGREASWLRTACGGGPDAVRIEVGRLLALDERVRTGSGFWTAPVEANGSAQDRTPSWRPRAVVPPPESSSAGLAGHPAVDDTGGFIPRRAIATPTGRHTISEPPDVVRARLRVLPMIYILILVGLFVLRRGVFGIRDPVYYRTNATVILVLLVLVALLWSRLPIALAGLKALELGMVGMLAGMFAWVQYRITLESFLRGDLMRAHHVLKNIVLLIAVVVLTYGLDVPKSWRRAALVVGPLAVLPFATLGVLGLWHPEATGWLRQGWLTGPSPRAFEFAFDGLILIILVIGATYGAYTLSGLRAGRSPRPGGLASIISGGGSAPVEWAKSTSPSTCC